MLEEVKKNTYPLDECLKICKENNAKDGLAFFLERAGNVTEAVDIMIDVSLFIPCICTLKTSC